MPDFHRGGGSHAGGLVTSITAPILLGPLNSGAVVLRPLAPARSTVLQPGSVLCGEGPRFVVPSQGTSQLRSGNSPPGLQAEWSQPFSSLKCCTNPAAGHSPMKRFAHRQPRFRRRQLLSLSEKLFHYDRKNDPPGRGQVRPSAFLGLHLPRSGVEPRSADRRVRIAGAQRLGRR